jgi:hypothetical protein
MILLSEFIKYFYSTTKKLMLFLAMFCFSRNFSWHVDVSVLSEMGTKFDDSKDYLK